jgi:putative membrane protein insertion efficiency factor
MGHRDSSAQFSRERGIFSDNRRTAGADAAQGSSRISAPARGAWLLLAFVRFYKIFLSPFLGGACKFYPTCSNYAYEAIARHGARRGVALALKRLGRCRPFTQGGYDPVPEGDEDVSNLKFQLSEKAQETAAQGKVSVPLESGR